MNRRRFLALSAFPLILPSGVLGQAGRPGANERVVTGHIGVGTRGRVLLRHLRDNAAAVCDVDKFHLRDGAGVVGPGVRLFDDYRDLLDQRDIDAVVIATPDHGHALQAIHACESGKDVYLESPGVRLPGEMTQLMRAATWFGRVVHVGPQAALAPTENSAREARVVGPENLTGGDPADDAPPPESLDWARWLGPAQPMPYNPARAHYQWRWLRELGGGHIRGTGADLFARALTSLAGGDGTGAVSVSATGSLPEQGIWDCPQQLEATFTLANGATLFWRTEAAAAGRLHMGDTTVAQGEEADDALRERLDLWLQAVRLRETDVAGLERACVAGVLGTLANTGVRLGRGFSWNPATGEVSDAQTARLLAFTGRGDHTL